MKKALFIDATMRENSRTARLAAAFLSRLDRSVYELESLKLDALGLEPLMKDRYVYRDELLSLGKREDPFFDLAHQFASADLLVIAAPFWDLSFPSLLKIYIENISVEGITFASSQTGLHGLCRAENLVYLTTRGGLIDTGDPLEQATPYLNALRGLLGYGEVITVAAKGLDIPDYDGEGELARAMEEAEKIAGSFPAN